jgi:hypothetical protein
MMAWLCRLPAHSEVLTRVHGVYALAHIVCCQCIHEHYIVWQRLRYQAPATPFVRVANGLERVCLIRMRLASAPSEAGTE